MSRNDLLLRAIYKEPLERFPVWLMRQAGRYMKEYRELREKEKDFLSLCKNVKLSTEISLLPLRLLKVDAIIIFSDILVPFDGAGIKVEYIENEGPKVYWNGDINTLSGYDPNSNAYVYEIIRKVKEEQNEVPVIGFCGAPFTLASYLIEGGASKDFRKTKVFMWEREYEFKKLMEILTEILKKYLLKQIEAGADVVQIFDSWAGVLSREDYEHLVFPYVEELVNHIKEKSDVPVIYFFRGSSSFIDLVEECKADVLSLDQSVDLPRVMLSSEKVFQGNLDPAVLYCNRETVKLKTLELLRSIPRKTGYIFNLAHGILPDMSFENVKTVVDTVKEFTF